MFIATTPSAQSSLSIKPAARGGGDALLAVLGFPWRGRSPDPDRLCVFIGTAVDCPEKTRESPLGSIGLPLLENASPVEAVLSGWRTPMRSSSTAVPTRLVPQVDSLLSAVCGLLRRAISSSSVESMITLRDFPVVVLETIQSEKVLL